jgi:hypothetical protein
MAIKTVTDRCNVRSTHVQALMPKALEPARALMARASYTDLCAYLFPTSTSSAIAKTITLPPPPLQPATKMIS